jgi:hypothetical protein
MKLKKLLKKSKKKKVNNQPPSPGWKPRPRLSALTVANCTGSKVYFFFFYYFLAESAIAPASAGWSIAD